MKGKSINPLERHVEKLFLLLIVFALLAVLVKQFATGGMTVKVGPQDNLSISQGYAKIASRAEQVDGQIKANTLDERAPLEAPDVGKLVGASARSFDSGFPFDRPDFGGEIDMEPTDPDIIREGVRYAMPQQTAPMKPLVRLGAGALDPIVVARLPVLQDVYGSEQPYDTQFVTVAAQFDARALRQSFSSDPDGAGPIQATPRHWWQGMLVLLDVELWRQEFDSDGMGGPEILISTMPGLESVREESLDDAPRNMQEVLEIADQAAETITRPAFYPIIAGPVWNPPAPPIELSPLQEESLVKLARYNRLLQEIEDKRDESDAIRNQGKRQSRIPVGEESIEDLWAGGMGGGGRGRGGGRRQNSSTKSADQRLREANERRILAIQDSIDRLEESQAEISAWFVENEIDPASVKEEDPGVNLLASPVGSLKDSDILTVWAHDIGAEPGMTYRYRVRLVYGNPFYGRENVINEEQRTELASSKVIRTEFSPWSDPVATDAESYMFMTRASADKGLGSAGAGLAIAEMYYFYYGYWRQSEIRLRAGDSITGLFELPDDLKTYEVLLNDDAKDNQGLQIAESPVNSSFERTMSSILLDVRRSARVRRDSLKGGRELGIFEAVIRGSDSIEIRNPEDDRASDRRRRLMESAELGATAVPAYPGTGGVAQVAVDIKDNNPRKENSGEENRDNSDRNSDNSDNRFGR